MSSDARSVRNELKPITIKLVRCKDCAYAVPLNDEKVKCPYHGEMFKTNSCTRRLIR